MQLFKRILAGTGGVLVLLVVVAFLLPRQATLSRSIDIAATPAALFPLVGDLRRFNEWSPWSGIDPATVYTFTGPADGVGQTMNWSSRDPRVGSGREVVLRLDPDKAVETGLEFSARGSATALITLAPHGTATTVTWTFRSDLGFNPAARYFGRLFVRWIGPDFDQGLTRLKALAEKAAPTSG